MKEPTTIHEVIEDLKSRERRTLDEGKVVREKRPRRGPKADVPLASHGSRAGSPPNGHPSAADSLIPGEPAMFAELKTCEPANPLADLLRGLPRGTAVIISIETMTGEE